MTDVRPQAMALQNSITLDKKFLNEISISHPTFYIFESQGRE